MFEPDSMNMCTITCTGKIVVQVYLCVQVPLVVTRSIYGRHKCPSCRVVVMLNVHNIMLVSTGTTYMYVISQL